MKLIRFGEPGMEKPGLEHPDGKRIDVSSVIRDYDASFFENNGLKKLEETDVSGFPEIDPDIRLGPPISRPSKIICVGLNYANHAREAKMDVPKEPILFFKATSSLCGPNDPVIIPKNSQKTDWEVELNIVIGKKALYVSKEDAYDYIAGYTVTNDYSEREFQLERGGQWVKGKSCDSFSPVGPWLVTKDEIADPNNLNLWLKVNGEIRQNSNTSEFIFNVETVVSYVSQFMSLLPGDMIFTGTPPGVGMGLNPPVFVREGDQIELGIEGLGQSSQIAENFR
jgi:2-keto-4-pentenoate hydratase/2-oxohepta-3-ene-1,7-dioic acid hydratase in catechol pathway